MTDAGDTPAGLLPFFRRTAGASGSAASYLEARWLVLRALGVLYASIFVSLAFQIRGLIGPGGILPAEELFGELTKTQPGVGRFWEVPSLLWLRADDTALSALVVVGLAAALLLVLGIAPRAMLVVCGVLFLSFAAAAQVFSEYQSDTMILEATAIGVVLAPRGLRPGLGRASPPAWAALWLLRWEWFRIYFESGLVKLGSGDPSWRDFTAMDHYYENGPLPTWIGWYAQQLPHGFHAATVALTLVIELGLVWLVFLPRPFKLACFALVTPLQIGIILTANYAFLNYLVLALGVLLVDDAAFARARRSVRGLVDRLRRLGARGAPRAVKGSEAEVSDAQAADRTRVDAGAGHAPREPNGPTRVTTRSRAGRLVAHAWLAWLFYATIAGPAFRRAPRELAWLGAPAQALVPFRVAGEYGLFAVMTTSRYEIELQGSRDGRTFVAYPFRFKPQDVREAPGIYAPYQPRFEWNLWFASLGSWRDNTWVVRAEIRLLRGDAGVLALFCSDPFHGTPPRYARAVISQYWMTDRATLRSAGAYWRREAIALYGPEIERRDDGTIRVVADPAPIEASEDMPTR